MKQKKQFASAMRLMLCIGLLFNLPLSALHPASAQTKIACVNTDYVLRNLPDYATAQSRLDKYVADWQKELSELHSELDALRVEFEQESYLLPENLKKRRQEEIKAKEQEIKTLQQQRFGAGGDLDRKRAELLKPIQDRVYTAIERILQEKNYAVVLDKAASSTVLFANKKIDISDEVLESLGYKGGTAAAATLDDNAKKRPSNPEMNKRELGGRSSATTNRVNTSQKRN